LRDTIQTALQDSAALLQRVAAEKASEIAEIAARMLACLRAGGKIALCGNGGSASQAQHLAGELVGRFRRERAAYAALALNTDTAILTAIGNDYGYAEVFRRQVEGLLGPGDLLIGLSTSGNAENIVRAVEEARRRGVTTVGLTGASGGRLAEVADLCLCIPHAQTSTVQEAHLAVGHLLCDLVEAGMSRADSESA
jgi:D-sedoheptulose 7-phosphate isomerase